MKLIKGYIYILKKMPILFISSIFLSIIVGCIPPLQVYFIKKIIDNFFINSFELFFYMIVLVLIVLLNTILPLFIKRITFKMNQKTSEIIESDIYKTIRNIDYHYFEASNISTTYTRLKNVKTYIDKSINKLFDMVKHIVSFFSFIILLSSISYLYGIIITPLLIFSLLFNYYEVKKIRGLKVTKSIDEMKSNYISNILTNKNSIKEIKIYNIFDYLINEYELGVKSVISSKKCISKKGFYSSSISQFINFIFIAINLIILLYLKFIKNADVNISSIISIVSAIPNFILLASFYLPNDFYELAFCYYFYEDFFIFVTRKNYSPVLKLEESSFNDELKISFENVCFSYCQNEKEILKNLNFSIDGKKITLIVGKNGSGKTTLIKLLLGLYKANSGKVLVNNILVENLSDEYRKKIFSSMFQENIIYKLSFKENICFDLNDQKLFEMSVEASGFNDVLKKYKSEEQKIGELYEKGVSLSGGEMQKLSTCRAIFSNSEIIIMDEPTSALDPKSEENFYNNIIKKYKKLNKGMIIISHRLSISKLVDNILVLNNGSIEEEGTHDKLMANGGIYYEMYVKQSNMYKEENK